MKRILAVAFALSVIFVLSEKGHADLYNRGTDSLGNRLIYDSDLDITWYDYTNLIDSWQNQVDWASTLSVNFGGNTYDDWRLPTTIDGPSVWGYDGTTTAGYNITTSELGYLFYTALGNKGYYDTSGYGPQPGWGLSNTGPFQDLHPWAYWSGTEYSENPDKAWRFAPGYGDQGYWSKTDSLGGGNGFAVRSGDVVILPEPISSILFLIGGTLFSGSNFLRKRRRS
jgi:hypothetical protein